MNDYNPYRIVIDPADRFIWNSDELLQFLIKYQGEHIVIDTHGEGCCLKSTGVYGLLDKFQFKSVVIRTHNLVEQHHQYTIEIYETVKKFFEQPKDTQYYPYHYWNQNRVFGAFYNRPSWHRMGLAAHLQHDHKDKTLLNFRANPHIEDNRVFFDIQKLFELHPESVEKFMRVRDSFPCQVEETDGYTLVATTKMQTDQLCSFYPEFLIDIVAETFTTGRTFYPTEKIVRPMLLKKPFIVMGPKNFLIHLRQLGFKTFSRFWDESYDGFDKKDRYLQILDLIDHLAKKSTQELQDMYEQMLSILEHNYQVITENQFIRKVTYVE